MNRYVCPVCHGVVSVPRRVPLERVVEVHAETCPGARKVRT